MQRTVPGFTLIELIVVFAIIGVLLSLAVSSYQTYVVRAQVGEGLALAKNVEMPVEATYRSDATAPADRVAAGLTPDPMQSGGAHVRLLNIVSGRIDLTFGGPRTHADIVGDTLSLTPYVTDDDTIVWRCGNTAAPPGGRLLTGGADHRASSVEPRYLPRNCR